MANAEKIVDYVSGLLSNLIPKPADAILKPLIKPVGDNLKAWLSEKETQKALLEAAQNAESDFREQAKEKFGNDKLTQAVASFPMHNGELFQAALQSLPSHFNETFLANHISNDLSKYWSGEFTLAEIQDGTALYIDCLRVRLLRVNGFADIVTRLAILRTDRRTEDILEIVKEILSLLSELLKKDGTANVLRSLHQLPPAPADFTGREAIVADILNDFDGHKGATISGLTGMGGIGKTALGLAVAHQIPDKYPDAQIFLDLKGTTTPLSVVDIARYVILQFQPGADLRGLDETNFSGAYQSVLHGRHALIFLDNASDAGQITPLIPPAPCALLVTSRRIFSVAGIKTHKVGTLQEKEAIDFLLTLCPRINDKAAELAQACAYLPLALRIAGSFLKVNMNWRVDKYLAELKSTKGRLETLAKSRAGAELITEPDVLATFELSYNQLKDEEKKNWRALGVFPAPFDGSAAAAVWGIGDEETDNLLAVFMRYSLAEYNETSARYELHDLLAEYARSQMQSGEEQEICLKHATHYKDILSAADDLYLKGNDNILVGLRLFDMEWEHIRTGQAWAVATMINNRVSSELCIAYSDAGAYVLNLRQHPREKIRWLELAISASREIGDRRGEGADLGNLGNTYHGLGEEEKGIELVKQALVIFEAIESPNAQWARNKLKEWNVLE